MKKNSFLFYRDYLKKGELANKDILIAKTKTSYLIGPLLNEKFDGYSFYRRLISNSLYSPNTYKKAFSFRCKKLINEYKNQLSDNDVIEIFKNGTIVKHKIIAVPRGKNEKE